MIILAATPIGNLGDVSRRLVEALTTATVIAAEDTRVTVHLLKALAIENRPQLISLHDHNERVKAAELVELARDTDLLVLSDAGMPTVSDPGFHLVDAAVAAGVTVTVLPGPSAVLTALAVSGLPTDRFTFEGFLPRKHGDRMSALREVADERRTMVFFESPNRLAASLIDLAEVLGADRRVVVCRELTKFFEEVKRGTAAELAEWAAAGVKGEIAIVVAGAEKRVLDLATGVAEVLAQVAAGARLKEAAADVSAVSGLGKRDLYEAALAQKPGARGPAAPQHPPLPF
ncbi:MULTISPECIES: 16S rRNA (cytidine(1402)-2'-O)-methyltransferase [unclassified Cryobacterium]|uniref:16S rRNA (cytidine(1402)-2'-O)-methyltransferase n=1 Tax=unclassified Cryobacterium TaxID=2649013 RepID=UPI00106D7593|nr:MULTISPECIES: 16S rRNA (cytidine(1402)-2'-O)-methyltransferase [unclassified Cryobacterium]MDY7526917.1 16S rRNA (cytidine(1402)-2'-O)-methyltransferase [Cryobacterium sp. 10C2]MDY7557284.1 16S rRNA (cytidine(1402)-2'-O)-methyltransferase [Cryobacterium sp. 10C3]MEB0003479.1 16S rRNA (cytidine(1402)-2'-O)-methyltransferase [Cryobacterium sp. RTC2.1]MEB0201139.1 16S rRNA (cytidine(1402)-2'-O)-methyltransferase [Cryobacterium sp. 5I3]MEB0286544.1 16S rRNA (cytidine(1402)-2'-O)-methyltransfera